jgi:hypothetical protein
MLLVTTLLAASAAAPSSSGSANPLVPAEKGQLQCYRPDVQKKTCQSIASYKRTGPGLYNNGALVALGNGATLETHTPVVVQGDAVCGSLRSPDVIAGTLRMGDRVVDPNTARPTLERIAQILAPILGKEICTRYEPKGTDFEAKGSIAGIYRADLDQTVKWISPSDGYSVAP